ncbi:hypothetical protein Avbf_09261 [Armadillidium vulgare]|nr:hypothetical protein Avbf_09261 [Armadillidium vulgare]
MPIIDRKYLSTYSKFLDACEKYCDQKYEESIALFFSLSDSSCSKFLISWKELMIGLNLEHLKRYEQALLAYKEALGQYELCYYALYLSARIFKEKGNVQAYIESLKLLSEVGEQTNSGETVDNSLHKFLLSYHVPIISNLGQRNKWLLASAYFEQQRWRDAKDELFEVLSNWKYVKNIAKSKILQTSDQFPDMPPKHLMKLCYLTSLLNLNEFQVVVSSKFATEIVDNLDTNVKELDYAVMVTNICAVVGSLVIVEGFYRLEKYESALTKSGSVLFTVEGWSVSSGPFPTLRTLIKVYLYKMLSLLYSKHPFNMWKNSTHFSRLQDHCLKLLQDTTQEVFCPASQLVYKILKHRIESFRIKLDNSSNS